MKLIKLVIAFFKRYVRKFLPQNLRDLLLEFLPQLWFARLLKMKQKTIGKEQDSLITLFFRGVGHGYMYM